MVSVDDYNEVKDCIYKDEHYSARDNGAVMRHQREGMRIRKDDNVWTFGKPNDKTGYMEIAGQRVHRIVAFAFLISFNIHYLLILGKLTVCGKLNLITSNSRLRHLL